MKFDLTYVKGNIQIISAWALSIFSEAMIQFEINWRPNDFFSSSWPYTEFSNLTNLVATIKIYENEL